MTYRCDDCGREHEHPGYCVECLGLHRIFSAAACGSFEALDAEISAARKRIDERWGK